MVPGSQLEADTDVWTNGLPCLGNPISIPQVQPHTSDPPLPFSHVSSASASLCCVVLPLPTNYVDNCMLLSVSSGSSIIYHLRHRHCHCTTVLHVLLRQYWPYWHFFADVLLIVVLRGYFVLVENAFQDNQIRLLVLSLMRLVCL